MTTQRLVDNFFRHEYGRLVAVLSQQVGLQYLQAVEDAVQSALLKTLDVWVESNLPDNPSAWLYRVARNELLGELRNKTNQSRILSTYAADLGPVEADAPAVYMRGEIQEDQLRMLLVCCDERIPDDSQLALALKTLCGFDVGEIAVRLFSTEANIYKRLSRARKKLQQTRFDYEQLSMSQQAARLPALNRILYVMFTEGYLSSQEDESIRLDLCEEAVRLCGILVEHKLGQRPETRALTALMYLQLARMPGRRDAAGGLLLLEEQDRRLWNQSYIQTGMAWLVQSASGEQFSRYHAEAGIAAEHCLASSYENTRWDKVVECYELLERASPSALHRLNRAVAMAEWQGAGAGLKVLDGFEPPSWLSGSYLWHTVLAYLHRRNAQLELSNHYRDAALASMPGSAMRSLFMRRLQKV